MKWPVIIALNISCILLTTCSNNQPDPLEKSVKSEEEIPNDWIMRQRAYPNKNISFEELKSLRNQSMAMKYSQQMYKSATASWQQAGPTNIGGRVSAIAVHPSDPTTWYVGAASGGVWKLSDYGNTIEPIFDDVPSLSVGAIAVDPNDPLTLYVGTGESSASSNTGAFPGSGMYKTTDGGATWQSIGLDQSRFIGRIAINPKNSQELYVAAMGVYWGKNSERGLYRSTNGGASWQQVLYVNDSTGCIDVVINPENPDTVYAAMWERIRKPGLRKCAGPSSAVWRSFDGGDTWTELNANGLATSGVNTGKIGLSLCLSSPNVLYAIYSTDPVANYFDELYKSTDYGNTWVPMHNSGLTSSFSSFGWYFGNVQVDPINPNLVYTVGFRLYRSTDGGINSNAISGSSVHVDQHDLWIDPNDNQFMVLGNDGGVYYSTNGGSNWTKADSLPITQFYTCEVDETYPNRYYGGTQDNGTVRTLTGSLNDWSRIKGGDGFVVRVNPVNNDTIFAESQYGNLSRSVNGGFTFGGALNGVDGSDRVDWNMPYVLDPNTPSTMYLGTERIYKSTNSSALWTPISLDLTDGDMNGYGTITAIAVSKVDENVLYAGTEDGRVWNTYDGGSTWNDISSTTSLPNLWVTSIECDVNDKSVAYVTYSGYTHLDYTPHIYQTTDSGNTWVSMAGNLPDFPINDLVVDPSVPGAFYIASDFGVYYTQDGGVIWEPLGIDLPNVSVFDLRLHDSTRKLVAGTYGRSMYAIDLNSVDPVSTKNRAEKTFSIFPNPSSGWIQFSKKVEEVNIYAVSGEFVGTYFPKSKNLDLTGKNLNGLYLFVFKTDDKLITRRVLFQ